MELLFVLLSALGLSLGAIVTLAPAPPPYASGDGDGLLLDDKD